MQRQAIERDAARRGDELTSWYAEKKSAKTLGRSELTRLRSDARTGAAGSRLYVFRLDRLARSGVSDTFKVVGEFLESGLEVICVSESLHLRRGSPDKPDIMTDVFLFAL